MIYKTSLDKVAKGITIAVTILFAAIIIGEFSLIKGDGGSLPIYTTAALLIIYFTVFAFRPLNYTLTSDKLIINRLFPNVSLDRNAIIFRTIR
jgi:hypothetical protein